MNEENNKPPTPKPKGRRRSKAKPPGQPAATRATAGDIIQPPTPPTLCPGCGSTGRGRYTTTRTAGCSIIYKGRPAAKVVRRWCKCTGCGQARVDRQFFDVAGEPI